MVEEQDSGHEATPEAAPLDVVPLAAHPAGVMAESAPLIRPFWRSVLYVVACTVVYLGGSLFAGILAGVWIYAKHGSLTPDLLMSEMGLLVVCTLLVCNPLLIATTCGFVWFVDRSTLAQIGLRRRGVIRELLLGTSLGVGYIVVLAATYGLLGWQHYEPVAVNILKWVGATVVIYPLIGLTEELVFRGYLLHALDEWRGRWVAIIVTSVLFWLPHLGQGNVGSPLGALAIMSIGLTFALCRYGSGGLWLPIGLHAAYDWTLMSLMEVEQMGLPAFFRVTVTAPEWLVGPPGHVGVADLGLHLLFLVVVYQWIYRPGVRAAGVDLGRNEGASSAP